MVAAGRLGRKAAHGYYEYPDDGPYRPADPEPLEPGGGDGRILAIRGDGPIAEGLRARAIEAGFRLPGVEPRWEDPEAVHLTIEAGARPPWSAGASVRLCASTSLAASGEQGACGFHLLAPLDGVSLVELTQNERTRPLTAEKAEEVFRRLGFHPEWVGDGPGLVLGRIVCQLVNEAAFAIGEGVGSGDDVDAGLTLGLSHPRGAVAWGEAIGLEHVLATIDGLWSERREERYRPHRCCARAPAFGVILPRVEENVDFVGDWSRRPRHGQGRPAPALPTDRRPAIRIEWVEAPPRRPRVPRARRRARVLGGGSELRRVRRQSRPGGPGICVHGRARAGRGSRQPCALHISCSTRSGRQGPPLAPPRPS